METILARTYAGLIGFFIVSLGVLGFVGTLITQSMLFGYFHIDIFHNAVHIISGLVGIAAAFVGGRSAARYILGVSLLYSVLTILGFILGGNILGLSFFNQNDNFLHAGIAIISMLVCLFLVIQDPGEFISVAGEEPVSDRVAQRPAMQQPLGRRS